MARGIDFLKSQINNAVMQHQTFVESLVDHEKQAEDARYRALCARFIPKAQAHQRMLEDYQAEIGAEAGTAKKVLGKALGIARLQQLGDMGERDHDEYHREANRLAQQMFVEHVREGDTTGLNISTSASTGFGTSTSSATSL